MKQTGSNVAALIAAAMPATRRRDAVYLLDGVDAHSDALGALGPHTMGAGCLYLKDLEKVDLEVLSRILERSLAWVEAGGTQGMQLTVTG